MSERIMRENLEQFLQMASQDLELQEKLKAASDRDAYISSVVELGKEKGYSFNSDSVEAALDAASKKAAEHDVSVSQLSDRELASVAGGGLFGSLRRIFSNSTVDCETKLNCFSAAITCTADTVNPVNPTLNPFQCPLDRKRKS
jgi:predicted ribosomally synthesized peptide with nif11-like leader